MRFNYLSVVGLLDPRLRDKLGVGWSNRDEREPDQAYALVRAYRVLPDRLTYFRWRTTPASTTSAWRR